MRNLVPSQNAYRWGDIGKFANLWKCWVSYLLDGVSRMPSSWGVGITKDDRWTKQPRQRPGVL